MRCLSVINVRWFNATAWYGLFQARLLREAGHDASILTLPSAPAIEVAEQWNIPVHTLDMNTANPLAHPGLYGALRRLVRDLRPHVVNCHRGENFILWALLRKRLRSFALVRTRGDQRQPKAGPVNRWLHRSCADMVAATNSAKAAQCRERLRIPEDRVWLDPGGVDTSVYGFDPKGRYRVRRELGYERDSFVIGLLGRLDPVKGQREAVEALAMLHKVGLTNGRLLCIGHDSTHCACEVRSWALEHDLQDAVTVTGRRDDVAACLSACDVGIVPSLGSEAIARAAFEVMACGRPLLASRVGVLPDLVPEAALFPPENPKELAKTVARAMTDKKYLDEVTWEEQGTIQRYSGREFRKRTLELYARAMGRAGVVEQD